MDNGEKVVQEFIQKTKINAANEALLVDFVGHLKERGQYVPDGDLVEHFIEKKAVKDKAGKLITIETCMVCKQEQFEVVEEEEKT